MSRSGLAGEPSQDARHAAIYFRSHGSLIFELDISRLGMHSMASHRVLIVAGCAARSGILTREKKS